MSWLPKERKESQMDITALSVKALVKSPEFTKNEKLAELERRESTRIPENYALASALARATAEVNR